MSGPSRRAHEDGNPSSSSSSYPSLAASGSNPSGRPFEMGQNSRVESRDGDRKSLQHSVHRESSMSVRDSQGDIPCKSSLLVVGSENRVKSRGSKDNLEDKVEKRDVMAEPRELYHQSSKGERGRKIERDKEGQKRREKDSVVPSRIKKESSHNKKKTADRTSKVGNYAIEHKKLKEFDSLRNVRRGRKERSKERDSDAVRKRPKKHSKFYDKDSDEGGTEAKEDIETKRDAFSFGVQRKKRTPRPRRGMQVAESEVDFRSQAQDGEGIQSRPKLSLIKYRVGKRLPELIRLWKEYESAHADKNIKDSASGPTLEILIPDEHFTTSNPGVAGSELWGTDIYTYDSDLVAVLMHMGYCHRRASPPSATEMLCATVRVLPPQDSYVSSLRNNVKSHARGAAVDCSYSIEQCCIVKEGGGTIDLEPNLTQTSTVGPTLAPVAAGHTTTSRAATSGALNQQYNLCNEPWSKFSISVVADTVMKKTRYASARLKMGEVLYLETHSRRYELCFAGEKMVKVPIAEKPNTHSMNDAQNTKTKNTLMDVFRFSKCKKALPQNVMRSIGIPLPLGHVKVIAENLDWEDVQWSQTGVCIAGKEYKLALVHFLSPN